MYAAGSAVPLDERLGTTPSAAFRPLTAEFISDRSYSEPNDNPPSLVSELERPMAIPKRTTVKIEQHGSMHTIMICGPSEEENQSIVREFIKLILEGHRGVLCAADLSLLASPASVATDVKTPL